VKGCRLTDQRAVDVPTAAGRLYELARGAGSFSSSGRTPGFVCAPDATSPWADGVIDRDSGGQGPALTFGRTALSAALDQVAHLGEFLRINVVGDGKRLPNPASSASTSVCLAVDTAALLRSPYAFGAGG
jgi:hypothetical protein